MRVLAYILPIIYLLAGVLWFYPFMKERCCQIPLTEAEEQGVDPEVGDTQRTPADEATTRTYRRPTGPEFFQFGNVGPLNEEDLKSRAMDLYEGLGDDEVLEIAGRYYGNEPNPDESENMGLARASYIRRLLGEDVDDEKLNLSAFRISDSMYSANPYFRGVDLKVSAFETPSVKEIEDRVEIRFPFGRAQRIEDPVIDQYLDDVAERVKNSGELIQLTGHTDSRSGSSFNYELGLRRANAIRDLLLGKGVPRNQIAVISKGEQEPVSSNATESGRALNRRVELEVIKR